MDSLYGSMDLLSEGSVSGVELHPVGEPETPPSPDPQSPNPAEGFNAVAGAVLNPLQTAAEILAPENAQKSGIPLPLAILGVCVVAVIWAASFTDKD